MTQLALSIPQSGQLNSTEDVKVANDLTSIQSVVNGNLDMSNIATGIVLQLAVTGSARKVAFGSVAFTWPGSNRLSNVVTVAHGLGVSPLTVVATPIVGAGGDIATIMVTTTSSTNISLQLGFDTFTPTAGTNYSAYWLAIG